MGSFFGFLKKNNNPEHNIDEYEAEKFSSELHAAIEKCKLDKQKAADDIKNMKEWATEVILEIYKVPHKFWYHELNLYDEIKLLDENNNISETIVLNTDKVIYGYLEQIKIKEAKLKFCEALYAEYDQISKKLKTAKSRIEELRKEDETLKMLNKHKMKLKEMNDSKEDMGDIYRQAEELNFLAQDIKEISDEFNFRKEMNDKILIMEKEASDESKNTTTEILNEEIDKLLSNFADKKNKQQ